MTTIRRLRRFPICLLAGVVQALLTAAPGWGADGRRTYRNPIARDVADPFVLKHRGQYYLYRTEVRGGLDVLTSRDLVHWREGPMVWRPEGPGAPNSRLLWAPEVFYENGRFYLFFAASGADGNQRLWRAVSDCPVGPFRTDPTHPLTEGWRIDVSLFQDSRGWNAYCCRRYGRPGGSDGALVEGMALGSGWLEGLTGRALPEESWRLMLEARDPWEGIWVEGPTILQDRSGYYMLYSAPDAESPNYQIGYATGPGPLGPWTRRGVLVPTVPGVPGPGHQGVVLAPDNLTPYLVYHRKRLAERGWNRDLMLDRLQMGGGRLATRAPTWTSQSLPPRPSFEASFAAPGDLRSWELTGGDWEVAPRERELRQRDAGGSARARLSGRRVRDGVVEVNLRRLRGEGAFGVALTSPRGRLPITLYPEGQPVVVAGGSLRVALPDGFRADADHQLLLTRRGPAVEVRLDGQELGLARLASGWLALELETARCSAAFSAIAVTGSVEPLPLDPPESPRAFWRRVGDRIEQRALGRQRQLYPLSQRLAGDGRLSARIQGWALGTSLPVRKYGMQVETASGRERFEAYVDPANGVLATHGWVRGRELPWRNSDLSLGFDYTEPHTLALERRGSTWRVTVAGASVEERSASLVGPLTVALVTEDARCEFREVQILGKGQETRRSRRRVPGNQRLRSRVG